MLELHGAVRLVRDRPDLGLVAGTKGVVVFDHATDPPWYEVEFFRGDDLMDTLAVLTVPEEDLQADDPRVRDGTTDA